MWDPLLVVKVLDQAVALREVSFPETDRMEESEREFLLKGVYTRFTDKGPTAEQVGEASRAEVYAQIDYLGG